MQTRQITLLDSERQHHLVVVGAAKPSGPCTRECLIDLCSRVQWLAIAASPLHTALQRSSHRQVGDRPIVSTVLWQIPGARLHMEGGDV
jgi:hypothetical protein